MVTVRYVEPESITDPALIARLYQWLDSAEVDRMNRFVQARHRHAFLVSHALTRKMIADAVGSEPSAIRFGTTGRGKPVVLSPTSDIHFNLSHTDGLIALALDQKPVGLDVEWLGRKGPGLELAHRYFTASEYADISRQNPEHQQHRLLVYWTLKEAYLKAEAWGIVDSLDGFEFLLGSDSERDFKPIELRILKSTLAPSIAWRFHHWKPTGTHLISLATAHEKAIDCRLWSESDW